MSYNTILATAPLTTQNYHLKMIGTSIGNSLIWDNGTNVGIGNTNTSYTLDVSGTGRFTSTLLVSGALTGTSASFVGTGDFSSGALTLTLGADNGLTTRTNLTQKIAKIVSYNYTNANNPVGMMVANNDGTDNALWIGGGSGATIAATNIQFYTAANNNTATGTPRMTITSSGNVGIGTSPATFLHVLGSNTSGRGQLCIQSNNASNAAKATWYYDTTQQGEIGTTGGDFYALAVNNFPFYAGGSERMRITSGGITQINGTNGAVRLTLQNTDNTAYLAFTEQEIRMWRPNGSGADFTIATQAISGTLGAGAISFCPWNVEQMRIVQNGNINFNTTVYNNTAVATTRTLYIGSDFRIGGLSSIRASKKNIENVSNINWLYELNPVTFNYRKKDEEGNYTEDIYKDLNYGLIAEDTQLVADFLINYNEKDGAKEIIGIEYPRLIIPMLKAIQELKAEIDELKNK